MPPTSRRNRRKRSRPASAVKNTPAAAARHSVVAAFRALIHCRIAWAMQLAAVFRTWHVSCSQTAHEVQAVPSCVFVPVAGL